MSQKKVDYRKEQKYNRKEIMKKEKVVRRVQIIVVIAILAALVGWFSVLVVQSKKSSQPSSASVTNISVDAFDEFQSQVSAYVEAQAAE
ncbi:MAG: hypothetical protein HUJ73_08385 [Eubacterium sp.]|nr:hypothetical protein [Eubacterium sp.]